MTADPPAARRRRPARGRRRHPGRRGQATRCCCRWPACPVLAWSVRTVRRAAVRRPGGRRATGPQDRAAVQAAGPGLRLVRRCPGHRRATRHASEWNALQALGRPHRRRRGRRGRDPRRRPPAGRHRAVRRGPARGRARDGGAIPVRPPARAAAPRPGRAARAPGWSPCRRPRPSGPRRCWRPTARPQRDGFTGTDTASCVEAYTDVGSTGVPAPATNLKITFPEDVALAEPGCSDRAKTAPSQDSGLEQPQRRTRRRPDGPARGASRKNTADRSRSAATSAGRSSSGRPAPRARPTTTAAAAPPARRPRPGPRGRRSRPPGRPPTRLARCRSPAGTPTTTALLGRGGLDRLAQERHRRRRAQRVVHHQRRLAGLHAGQDG